MQEPQTPPTPERLTRLAFAFAPPLLLQTAVELQIFDFLDQAPMNLNELSSRTGASVRGLRALLNALLGFDCWCFPALETRSRLKKSVIGCPKLDSATPVF